MVDQALHAVGIMMSQIMMKVLRALKIILLKVILSLNRIIYKLNQFDDLMKKVNIRGKSDPCTLVTVDKMNLFYWPYAEYLELLSQSHF